MVKSVTTHGEAETQEGSIGSRRLADLLALLGRSPTVVAYLIIVALVLIGQALIPGFFAVSHIVTVLNLSAILGVVAAGQTVVVVSGGIDVSVGPVVSLAEVLTVSWAQGGNINGLAPVLVIAAVVGLINALGVSYLRINALVMTLGTGTAVSGFLLVITNGSAGGQPPAVLSTFMRNSWLGLPGPLWAWLGVALITVLIVHQSRFGRSLYALGTNKRAARVAGISESRVNIGVYILSSLAAAVAGITLAGFAGTGYFGIGNEYTMLSIAAVVIGGASILGGKGSYYGTIAGVIILGLISDILTVSAVAAAGRSIIEGASILLILVAYGREKALRA
ncbi:MAG: ABC transporter permease [Candidatus Limnocylindrales bacterium]